MDLFRELGEQVDDRWRALDYDERAFPALAAEALESAAALDGIDAEAVLRWVAAAPRLPSQADVASDFSDLALTLFETPRFFVSVLFWLDGSTAVHQHSFSGAFRVLHGGSIHTRFRFREERLVNQHFKLGSVERESVELLTRGSVRPIESGSSFIHSLFHLEHPSVSIVLRTGNDPATNPQWSYEPAGVAIDPFWSDRVSVKKLEAARVLLTLGREIADPALVAMLEQADLHATYSLLECIRGGLDADPLATAFEPEGTEARFQALLEVARKRHGAIVDRFVEGDAEKLRQAWLYSLRGQIKRAEERFLLALMLNFPGIDPMLELLAERYPDREPIEAFLDSVQELGNTRPMNAHEGNLLELPAFDAEHRVVLKRLVLGGSVRAAADDLAAAFGEAPEAAASLAETIAAELRGTRLLGPLVAAK